MRHALAAGFAALLATSGQAQLADFSDPPRPPLAAGVDTNDARAYASFATASRKPAEAYAGFLWAHRLRPTRLDYLAGMIGALNVGRYELRGNRRRKDRDAAASAIRDLADSLEQVLVFRDPFFGLRPLNGRCSAQPMAEMRVEELVARGLAGLRTGCYYGTIAYLEEAAQRDTMLEHLLHFRALAWHKTQRPEEAAADLQRAIIGVRRLQSQSIEDSWYTTAILEYVLGMMYARFNDRVSARRAFERAIGEDLAFYMAHVRLAELAMGRRDLNDAVESLSLATEMRPDDALVLASYAQALVAVGRLEDARAAYAKAITHAPHYADLRFTQAELFDRTGDAPSALDSYRAYVARASRQDSAQIDFANDRIASLTPDP